MKKAMWAALLFAACGQADGAEPVRPNTPECRAENAGATLWVYGVYAPHPVFTCMLNGGAWAWTRTLTHQSSNGWVTP